MKKIVHMVPMLALLLAGSRRGVPMLLANEKDEKDDKGVTTSKSAEHWKRKTALAINADPTMSDDDLEKAHDEHMSALTTALAANEAETTKEEEPEVKTTPEKKVDVKPDEMKLANERAAKLEKQAGDLLIGNALTEGRILPTAKKDWEGKFANDFTSAQTDLAKETKKLNTTARTTGLREQNHATLANERERRDELMSLVNEEMKANGNNYDLAFSSVQAKHKELFGKMKQPAAPQKK